MQLSLVSYYPRTEIGSVFPLPLDENLSGNTELHGHFK